MTGSPDSTDLERELSAVVTDVRGRARSADDRRAFLSAVCERLVGAGLYSFTWYGKLDIDAERPEPIATATATDGAIPDAAIDIVTDTGLAAEAFRTRSVQSMTALQAATSDGAIRTLVADHGIGSVATVPVMPADAGVPYGVLIVYTRRSDAFGDDETGLLGDVATAVGRGIESVDAGRVASADKDGRRIDGIARAIPGLLFIYDADGRYEEVLTPQYVRNFTTPEELIGQTVYDVLPEDVADTIHGAIQRALETGEPQEIEYALEVAGEEVWIAARIAPLSPSVDDRVVFVGRHITERKEYEKQLERYERLFENATDCIVESEFVDGEPVVRGVNAAFEETFGYDESEVVGEHLDDLITPEEYDDEAKEINDRVRKGEDFTMEVTRMAADGPREFLLRPSYFDDEVSYAIFTDITERKRRERELRRSRERYRTLFENNQLVLWEFDLSAAVAYANTLAAGTDDLVAYLDEHPEEHERILDRMEVLDVNEEALTIYEAPSKQALVENLDRVMTEDSLDSLKGLWASLVDGATAFRTECKYRTFEGKARYLYFDVNVPDYHADDYARVYMSGLDITERKERERELERKNEFLDEFASVVSHDVATPLSVIENKARLIELTGDTSHAEDIYDATERVQELIDELRELARQGKRVDETGPVELGEVTREAWHSVETTRSTLTVESSGTVEASRDRLRQLLENLLENAVDHGSTDDAVTIGVGTLPNGFYVADDGSGIDADEREEIFEQGYTTDDDSTGLGLAIVRRIVEGHGWTIEVIESADGGARFEIRTDT